jgi:hypothetical protein
MSDHSRTSSPPRDLRSYLMRYDRERDTIADQHHITSMMSLICIGGEEGEDLPPIHETERDDHRGVGQ